MRTEEERIKAIVDEIQAGSFTKYDVHLKITLKKKKEEQKAQRS